MPGCPAAAVFRSCFRTTVRCWLQKTVVFDQPTSELLQFAETPKVKLLWCLDLPLMAGRGRSSGRMRESSLVEWFWLTQICKRAMEEEPERSRQTNAAGLRELEMSKVTGDVSRDVLRNCSYSCVHSAVGLCGRHRSCDVSCSNRSFLREVAGLDTLLLH